MLHTVTHIMVTKTDMVPTLCIWSLDRRGEPIGQQGEGSDKRSSGCLRKELNHYLFEKKGKKNKGGGEE